MLTKVTEKPALPEKPEKAKGRSSSISAPKFSILSVTIRNVPDSPLVIHAFSAKQRNTMKEAQVAGSVGRSKRKRAPKDFDEVYNNARHISKEGWDGIAAASFRNAMISACRLVDYKMSIGKMTVFIIPDGQSAADRMPLVRIHGTPERFEAVARNQTGVADIRVRPRWDEWSARLRMRFDTDKFTEDDVINLLVRAGAQVGVGEGRPDSSNSFGLGWGMFEIDISQPIQLETIEAPRIELMRG